MSDETLPGFSQVGFGGGFFTGGFGDVASGLGGGGTASTLAESIPQAPAPSPFEELLSKPSTIPEIGPSPFELLLDKPTTIGLDPTFLDLMKQPVSSPIDLPPPVPFAIGATAASIVGGLIATLFPTPTAPPGYDEVIVRGTPMPLPSILPFSPGEIPPPPPPEFAGLPPELVVTAPKPKPLPPPEVFPFLPTPDLGSLSAPGPAPGRALAPPPRVTLPPPLTFAIPQPGPQPRPRPVPQPSPTSILQPFAPLPVQRPKPGPSPRTITQPKPSPLGVSRGPLTGGSPLTGILAQSVPSALPGTQTATQSKSCGGQGPTKDKKKYGCSQGYYRETSSGITYTEWSRRKCPSSKISSRLQQQHRPLTS